MFKLNYKKLLCNHFPCAMWPAVHGRLHCRNIYFQPLKNHAWQTNKIQFSFTIYQKKKKNNLTNKKKKLDNHVLSLHFALSFSLYTNHIPPFLSSPYNLLVVLFKFFSLKSKNDLINLWKKKKLKRILNTRHHNGAKR